LAGTRPLGKEGARFHDDQRLGKGPNSFKFNNYGFTAICNMVGVSDLTLLKIQTPELASTVLNDLMSGALVSNRRANNAEIVLDEDIGNVIGIVSKKYVGYSNDAFLRDVLTCLDEDNNGALFPTTGDFPV
jgi:hypothetical protein